MNRQNYILKLSLIIILNIAINIYYIIRDKEMDIEPTIKQDGVEEDKVKE